MWSSEQGFEMQYQAPRQNIPLTHPLKTQNPKWCNLGLVDDSCGSDFHFLQNPNGNF